jgi:hypothetical protein
MAGLTFRLGQLPDALQTDTTNNVGIGGSPSGSYKLEVTGTLRTSGALTIGSSASFAGTTLNTSGGFTTSVDAGYRLRNDANSANLGGFTRRSYWAGGAALDTQIFAETGYSIYLNVNGSSTTGMFISSSGNVGIGTSSPGSPLEIVGGVGGSDWLRLTRTGVSQWAFNSTSTGLSLINNNTTITAMTLAASGSVGIGVTNPFSALTIYTAATTVLGGNTGSGVVIGGGGGSNGNYSQIGFTQNASSVYSPAAMGYVITTSSGFTYGDIVFGTRNVNTDTAPSERMRITSAGVVGIGDSGNASYKLSVTGTSGGIIANSSGAGDSNFLSNSSSIGKHYTALSGASTVFYVASSGQIYSTSTSITSISDIAYKENIKTLETGLNEIMALKPIRFDWKEGRGNGNKNVVGFIAQDLELVLPDLVEEYEKELGSTETLKGIKMSDLIPTLVKAIQEMNATITSLQEQITELKNK